MVGGHPLLPLSVSVWVVVGLLTVIWGRILWRVVDRVTADRQLRHALLLSYAVRVGLGLALFLISYWGLPILKSIQLEPGFWSFAVDAKTYHVNARELAYSWSAQVPFRFWEPRIFPYALVVALFYWPFGPHPLYPLAFNAWCGAMCGLLAYRLAGRCAGKRARLPAALLVAFWPSSFLWSALLLKDALTWLVMLTTLWVTMAILHREPTRGPADRGAPWRWLVRWGSFALILVAVISLRFYLGFTLLVAIGLVAGPILIRAAFKRQFWREARLVGLVLFLVVFVVMPALVLIWRVEMKADQSASGFGARPAVATSLNTVTSRVMSRMAKTFGPAAVLRFRRGYLLTGGHSIVDTKELSTFGELLRHLPQAAMVALLAPFPSQWFDHSGSTGPMRTVASVEMLLLYALLVSLVIGMAVLIHRRGRVESFLLVFTFLLFMQLALVVPNIGTLFRSRLTFLFPLLIIVSGAVLPSPYRAIERFLLRAGIRAPRLSTLRSLPPLGLLRRLTVRKLERTG